MVLRHEWMDVRRVVHLDQKPAPPKTPRTSLGYSVGRFEGGALIIDTTNYSAGVLNQYVEEAGKPTRGLLHSAALTSRERLSFDAARQRLIVEIDLTDSEFFTKPFPRATLEYAPSDLTIEPFKCLPADVTGALRK